MFFFSQKFRAHDRLHPQSSEIYAELGQIFKELIERGHRYDASWIVRPTESNETVLCGHSEQLDIAANFIGNAKPT